MKERITHSFLVADSLSLLKNSVLMISDDGDKELLNSQINSSFSDAEKFFNDLLVEAEAVLAGNNLAAERLVSILRSVPQDPQVEKVDINDLYQSAEYNQLEIIQGTQLMKLVAGTVWAANNSDEASELLFALTVLLTPLFHLEKRYSPAIEVTKGNPGPMQMMSMGGDIFGGDIIGGDVFPPKLPKEWNPFPDRFKLDGRLQFLKVRPKFPEDHLWWRDKLTLPGHAPWNIKCSLRIAMETAKIQATSPRYSIDSITPSNACAGEIIKLRGRNFGTAGTIEFASGQSVNNALWSDTEIEVMLPDDVTAGEISLKILQAVISVCNKSISVYRLGTGMVYEGGIPVVYNATIYGNPPGLLRPGIIIPLEIWASNTPETSLKVELIANGVYVVKGGIPGGHQTVNIAVPLVSEPLSAEIVITISNRCKLVKVRYPVSINVLPKFSITFVEVTQGVQTSHADQMNGMPLMPMVAFKDTAVRVYFHADMNGTFNNTVKGITGFLEIDNLGIRFAPSNLSKVADIEGDSDGFITNSTLNFTLPAGWLSPGTHQIKLGIFVKGIGYSFNLMHSLPWTWYAKTPMPVRFLWLDKKENINGAIIYDFAKRSLDYLPTSLSRINVYTNETLRADLYDLTTKDGWEDLLSDLDDERDDAGEIDGTHWVGIIPNIDGVIYPWGGLAVTPSNTALSRPLNPMTGAHELAHTYGLRHVLQPLGKGSPLGPYDTVHNNGVLTHVPFVVRNREAETEVSYEAMSYNRPRGFGYTNWLRLFNMNF